MVGEGSGRVQFDKEGIAVGRVGNRYEGREMRSLDLGEPLVLVPKAAEDVGGRILAEGIGLPFSPRDEAAAFYPAQPPPVFAILVGKDTPRSLAREEDPLVPQEISVEARFQQNEGSSVGGEESEARRVLKGGDGQ